ncbi:succinyl-diaminopimelate desuccinylase [Corynebacterium kutscheri]|uniref:Succinyl-diaminopimelate desuccinylase n=1 Tax=Corynebacterium kutscheri TaxID=35755 RepID=A0AB38VTU8_9CORY|nr:succinyl-diaminopimelate desuccinylase [Corynebacterium kutscheri]VEH08992.1 succinyl-diaminopimelate desuccinylase [Corynebacterium kutscheri]
MLNLSQDPIELTRALVDIPSPSHEEKRIADELEQALRIFAQNTNHVEVLRHGNTVMARTQRGLGSRIILAGHIDTVPIADNIPAQRIDDILYGCGTVDMKSGLACYISAFVELANSDQLSHELTLICYEGEEVASEFNGLGHIQTVYPQWLVGDLALLGEPSGAIVEAGCQGSIRLRITVRGVRAHSARSWLGVNAMHQLAPVISRIAQYQPREAVEVDGCTYREGLNIVHIESGVATNTIPDEAWLFVNFRFAPDRSLAEAMQYLLEVLNLPETISYEVDDAVAAARPGLDQPAAQALVKSVGQVRAKYGWTDVARFSELGIPAVNFGPGDPSFAHKKEEQLPVAMITEVKNALINFLSSQF